jgi:hypothetical protein
MHHRRSKSRQRRNDQTYRRIYNNVSRSARLEPHTPLEPVGNTGIVDDYGTVRQVANDGTSIRVDMIVPMTHIAMLAVRLGLFLRTLRDDDGWMQERCDDGDTQAGNDSHGSSPSPDTAPTRLVRLLISRLTGFAQGS